MKMCRCGKPALPGILYCAKCKKPRLKQLEGQGYLDPHRIGHVGERRTDEAREDIRETKFGKDR
jgi:hypothetical protein